MEGYPVCKCMEGVAGVGVVSQEVWLEWVWLSRRCGYTSGPTDSAGPYRPMTHSKTRFSTSTTTSCMEGLTELVTLL